MNNKLLEVEGKIQYNFLFLTLRKGFNAIVTEDMIVIPKTMPHLF